MNKDLIIKKKYWLILGDIALLYFSLWFTLVIRYQGKYHPSLFTEHLLPFSVVFFIWLVIFYIDDLYELTYRQGRVGILIKLIRDVIIGGIFAIIFFYLGQNRLFSIRPQTILLINILTVTTLIYIWRIVFNLLTESSKMANGILIVGFNPLVQEIIKEINQKPQLGFQVKKILTESELTEVPTELKPLFLTNHFRELKSICHQNRIDTIVSTIHPRQNPELAKSLFECLSLKITFFDMANFYEKITGKIPVNTIEQVWFLENLTEGNKKIYEIAKTALDWFCAMILLILTLPFVPLIALIIKIDSRGPILFTQIRTGKDGHLFRTIKFRTMVQDAENNGPQWATKNDPRVTKLGRILRKTRIDEIPQLINILKGEMSLIGPRPERPEFVEQLEKEIPFYKERLLIKPGLTGWAQVAGPAYGGSKEETLEKLQYDLFYIKNRSLVLDLTIILKTVKIILTRKGQ